MVVAGKSIKEIQKEFRDVPEEKLENEIKLRRNL